MWIYLQRKYSKIFFWNKFWKEVQFWAYNYCIHFLELDTLLKKLDNEDLDVLYNMLEETYEDGEGEGLSKLEQRCQEQYDKGYSEGFDDGLSTEE